MNMDMNHPMPHAMQMGTMSSADDNAHERSAGHKWLTYLTVGTALTAGAVILAPHILPLIGIGTTALAASAGPAVGVGGPAAAINSLLGAIPWAGKALAEGGLWSAIASGGIGVGGILLANYISKREDGSTQIHWSKIIRTAALITSTLVALPVVLSSISTGITFLSAVIFGLGSAKVVGLFMSQLLGGIAHVHAAAAASGLIPMTLAHLPHIAAILAPVLSFGLSKKTSQTMSTQTENSTPAQGSILARIEVEKPTEPGVPCIARLRLTHAESGIPLTAEELAVVHEAKIHLFIADSSLKDYHHIHPVQTDEPGVYAFTFTPRTGNNYAAWADMTLQKNNRNYRIKESITSASGRNIPPSIHVSTHAESHGMVFDWKSAEPLKKGSASIVEVSVTDTNGNPVNDLEPVMGAFGHLVGFGADGKTFIHTHPMDREPVQPNEHGGPHLRFHVEPDTSGPVQFYFHLKRGGKEIYVPFGQQVQFPALATQRVTDQRHAMHNMQMAVA
jgi:hypothetical protein